MRLRLLDKSFVVDDVQAPLIRPLRMKFNAAPLSETRVKIEPRYIGALQAMYRDSLVTEEPVQRWLESAFSEAAVRQRISPHIPAYKGGYQMPPMLNAIQQRRYGVYLDVGAGKTMFTLELTRQLGPTVLITQPLIWANAYVGTRERPGDWFKFYRKNLPRIVDTTFARGVEERRALLDQRADIYVISCYALGEMADWIRDLPAANLIVDESDNMRSPETRIAQVLHSLTDRFANRFLLSANPAPNDFGEFWSQMHFLVPLLLGTYEQFCRKYGEKMRHGWVFRDEAAAAEVLELVKPYVCMLTKADFWKDAPALTISPVAVDLTPEQWERYRELEADQQVRVDGGTIIVDNESAQEMKLRQIAAGIVYNGRRAHLIGKMPAKMAVLKDLLFRVMIETKIVRGRRVKVGKQVIIWAHFKAEMRLLERMLEKWGVSFVTVGGQNQASKDALNTFLAGKVRVMVSHADSAGHGLRAEVCNQMIFLTPDYSSRAFWQAIGRIHRPPQTKDCNVYVLIGKGTVDQRPWAALRRKIQWTGRVQEKLGNRADVPRLAEGAVG